MLRTRRLRQHTPRKELGALQLLVEAEGVEAHIRRGKGKLVECTSNRFSMKAVYLKYIGNDPLGPSICYICNFTCCLDPPTPFLHVIHNGNV